MRDTDRQNDFGSHQKSTIDYQILFVSSFLLSYQHPGGWSLAQYEDC